VRQALDVAVRDGLLAQAGRRHQQDRDVVAQGLRVLQYQRHVGGGQVPRLLVRDGWPLHLGGEVAGLRWADLDLEKSELRVRNTLSRVDRELILSEPKTARSLRRVPLHPGVVTALKGWREQQVQERLPAGHQWTDTDMVFCTEFGTMLDPRNLLRTVEIAATKAGLGKVGAHTMRHSAAVAWLEDGVHIKAAADLLGHSSISVTGDLYGHTSDDVARPRLLAWVRRSGCERAFDPVGVKTEKGTFRNLKNASALVGLTGFEPATT
jgi:integrase